MTTDPWPAGLLDGAHSRRQLLRGLGLGWLAVSAPTLLAACGSKSSPGKTHLVGTDKQVDHLSWLTSTTTTLDWAKDGSQSAASHPVLEPLLRLDENNVPVGHVAESWKQTDATTYVYKLRQGVKFSDGSPLTAEDVVFSITRHLDPKLGSLIAGIIPPLASVAATGPDEVTVRLKKPNATWRYVPTNILVGKKKEMQALGPKDYGAPGKPLTGTGPFKVTSFDAANKIEYVANPTWWGGTPIAKKLTMQANIADAQTSLLAMRSGGADGTFGVSAYIISDWQTIPDVTITKAPSANATFASFDLDAKPWNDVHLRRAFAHALDRDGLLHALLADGGTVENSIIPRAAWSGVSKSKLDEIYGAVPVYDYDLAKARAELQQSAYAGGLTATIWYYASDTIEKVALTWAEGLKKIGVTLKLEVASSDVGASREDGHKNLGFHLNDNWSAYYPDPTSHALDLLYGPHAKVGFYNEANYRNPSVDKLIEKNLAETDQNTRANLIGQVMEMAANDLPYVPIWTRDQAVALKNDFVFNGFTSFYDSQNWVTQIKSAS